MAYRTGKNQPTAKGPPNRLAEEARHLRLKKRFSQHFMINESVLDRMTERMALQPEETIIEIGPGGGFLTEKLLATGAKVIAIELDKQMCVYLRKKFADTPNFELVEQDVLHFDFNAVSAPQYKVIGNLPYQITSK